MITFTIATDETDGFNRFMRSADIFGIPVRVNKRNVILLFFSKLNSKLPFRDASNEHLNGRVARQRRHCVWVIMTTFLQKMESSMYLFLPKDVFLLYRSTPKYFPLKLSSSFSVVNSCKQLNLHLQVLACCNIFYTFYIKQVETLSFY